MPTSTLRYVSGPTVYMLVLAALAMAAAATGAGLAHAALPGLSCKPVSIRGTGFHVQKQVAQKIALVGWTNKVAATYGQSWASWGRAAQRTVNCVHNPSPSRHGWYCVVRGRPCRYRPPGISPHRYRAPHPARPELRREYRRQEYRRQ